MSDAFALLRTQFIDRCRDDLAELSRERVDSEAFATLVHRLAGTAGSFGFPELSAAAGAVDQQIRNGEGPSATEVEALIRALEKAIRTNS